MTMSICRFTFSRVQHTRCALADNCMSLEYFYSHIKMFVNFSSLIYFCHCKHSWSLLSWYVLIETFVVLFLGRLKAFPSVPMFPRRTVVWRYLECWRRTRASTPARSPTEWESPSPPQHSWLLNVSIQASNSFLFVTEGASNQILEGPDR